MDLERYKDDNTADKLKPSCNLPFSHTFIALHGISEELVIVSKISSSKTKRNIVNLGAYGIWQLGLSDRNLKKS